MTLEIKCIIFTRRSVNINFKILHPRATSRFSPKIRLISNSIIQKLQFYRSTSTNFSQSSTSITQLRCNSTCHRMFAREPPRGRIVALSAPVIQHEISDNVTMFCHLKHIYQPSSRNGAPRSTSFLVKTH